MYIFTLYALLSSSLPLTSTLSRHPMTFPAHSLLRSFSSMPLIGQLSFPWIYLLETLFYQAFMQILLDAAVKPYPPYQICFCFSPFLICASPSDYCFPELLLMKLSFPSVHGPMPDSTAKPNLLYQIPFLLLPEILYWEIGILLSLT